jgi:hypothetical protein
MENMAKVVTWVVLVLCCFYTVAELALGIVASNYALLYPPITLVATLAAYRYRKSPWLAWGSVGLNAIFAIAGLALIVLGNPPLWWSIFIGGGAILGSAVLNIVTLVKIRKSNASPGYGANTSLERTRER